MSTQFLVYLVGVVILGIFYAPLKSATGGGVWFVLCAVIYLFFVRIVGHFISKYVSKGNEQND